MATFEELRTEAIRRSGVRGMFEFRQLGEEFNAYWDKMNDVEFRRGYKHGEYEKPDTPALCEMDLLTAEEFENWLLKLDRLLTDKK